MGGNTDTGKAIKFANDKLFALSERGPNGIAKIAVVLTDGKSQDEVLAAAEAARKKGIILFAIALVLRPRRQSSGQLPTNHPQPMFFL